MDPNRSTSAEAQVQKCRNLIASTEINYQEKSVLIVGMPGAGKKTLLQFLCEGRSALRAEKNSVGEYCIIYEMDIRIKEPSHCPTFFRSTESEDVYCLYPAFGKTEGVQETGTNLATSYFMKDLLRHVEKIKILVICTYSAIKEGTNSSDFRNLMDQILMFVPNIEKYRDSIALIATKIDNHGRNENGEDVLVDDTEIIRHVASCLKNYRKDIEKNADGDFVRKVNELVGGFLKENERGFEKLDIFRKPNKEGLLHDMELLTLEKNRIQKMIKNNIVFCATNPNDFEYPLSYELKISIVEFYDEIHRNIRVHMHEIGEIIEQSLESVENESNNIYDLLDAFSSAQEKLENLLENETNDLNIRVYLSIMDALCNFLHSHSLPNTYLENIWNIREQYERLTFLGHIYSDKRMKYSPSLWMGKFKNCKKKIQNSIKFYSFLIDLYEKLSSYDVQKDVIRYMHLKTKILNNYYGKDVEINDVKMRSLERLFQLTSPTENFLKHYYENNDTCFIFGDFVKLSDVEKSLSEETKILIIFATKIFIDASLVNTDRDLCRIFVIALIWEVIGEREIVLDGKDANDASPPTAATGCDGESGPPGKSAGNFIAVGARFLNGRNLKISARGGKGGRGQNGGEGAKRSVVVCRLSSNFSLGIGFNVHHMHSMHTAFHDLHVRTTKFGDGGRGGNGGKGGAAGDIKIFTLSTQKDRHGIRTSIEIGENGQPGSEGKRGDGKPNEISVLALPAVDDPNIDSSDDWPHDADFNVILMNYWQQLQEGRAEIEIFLHDILHEFDEIIEQLNVT